MSKVRNVRLADGRDEQQDRLHADIRQVNHLSCVLRRADRVHRRIAASLRKLMLQTTACSPETVQRRIFTLTHRQPMHCTTSAAGALASVPLPSFCCSTFTVNTKPAATGRFYRLS